MKKKVIIGVFVAIFISGLIYMIVVNTIFNENMEMINEYIPEVEISDSELRRTIVTLYFINSDNGSIQSESRLIDSKELLREPYTALIGMLIKGSNDTKLKSAIPENTRVLGTTFNRGCVTVNLSKEFVDNAPENVNDKANMIYTIINTLTELKEVQSVRFLIDGESIEGFSDEAVKLTNEFARKK